MAKKAMPGAVAAFAFNHVRRISRHSQGDSQQPRHAPAISAPSYMVHADCTPSSWAARVKEIEDFAKAGPPGLSAAQGEVLASAGRVVIMNLWRLISSFRQPSPTHLALCDVRSVDLKSALPYHFLINGFLGTNYGLDMHAAAAHEWYYFPELAAHEVVAFKAYDSLHEASNGPAFTFHAAVDDQSALDGGCAPRESIEVRVALAFPA